MTLMIYFLLTTLKTTKTRANTLYIPPISTKNIIPAYVIVRH